MNFVTGIFFILTIGIIEITSSDAGLGCDCKTAELAPGCFIDPKEPPPIGYKCNCKYVGGLEWCYGELEKCDSREEHGCSGCSERQCCSDKGPLGNCYGYISAKSRHDPSCKPSGAFCIRRNWRRCCSKRCLKGRCF